MLFGIYAYKIAEQSAHPRSLISAFGVRCYHPVLGTYIGDFGAFHVISMISAR